MECSEMERNQCEKKGIGGNVILSAKELTLGYGKTDIVRGVTLTIHRAEIVTIIGPNGSGKSTLLKALARILPLRSGRIRARALSKVDFPEPFGPMIVTISARCMVRVTPRTISVFP